MDWNKIRAEYIAGGTSYRKLAEKYGVPLTTLSEKGKRECWVEKRKQSRDKVVAKIVNKNASEQARKAVRIASAADRLLTKIEQAIDELDLQIAKETKKIKEIQYNNLERPDKPTKEIISETEKIISYKSIIDRKGLQAVAKSLADIKDVLMIKSDLDNEEQKARIANLKRQAESGKQDDLVKVVIDSNLEKYSE